MGVKEAIVNAKLRISLVVTMAITVVHSTVIMEFDDDYLCTDVDFEPVYFELDSTTIPQHEKHKISAVVRHLNSHIERFVIVEGNCDERGSNEYNMLLSENRAIAVSNCLVQSGVAAERVKIQSYGEERPAFDGHNERAWARNRRVDFSIFREEVIGGYIVYECPHCGARAHRNDLLSYNTFGGTFWSDCFRIAPMAPSQDIVSRCWKCKKAFCVWAAKISRVRRKSIPKSCADNPYITLTGDYLTVKEALEAEADKHDIGIEFELRLRLLWVANHRDRKSVAKLLADEGIVVETVPDTERRENLQRLSTMTNMPLWLKAEILREKGSFNAAKATLDAFKNAHHEEYKEDEEYFKEIEKQIEKKNEKVFVR